MIEEDNPTSTWLKASCHCGALKCEVRVTNRRALACNCSICHKKGFLHVIAKREDVKIAKMGNRVEYRFGSKTAVHYHCDACGITPYYIPRSHPDSYSINLRCLDDVDMASFEIVPFDGQNWEKNIESIR